MTIDTVRKILYEIALAIIFGVVIFAIGTAMYRSIHRLTIERFKNEYVAGTPEEQQRIASTYLKYFPVPALMIAVEETYSTGVCHVEGHPVGRALYAANPNFSEAIRQCGGSCTYGCFHGVLMGMFSTDSDTLGGLIQEESPQQYLEHVKREARDLCTKPEVESVVRPRYCYHGLGHIFMYLNGADLKGAIHSCDIFSDYATAAGCRSGVFMDYLLSTSSASLLRTHDEKPCDMFPEYASSCYRYKAYGWLYSASDLNESFRICPSLGENEILCIRSIAQAYATLYRVESQEEFKHLCGSFSGERKSACVEGAFLRIVELNDGDDSAHACDSVEEPYRQSCVVYQQAYLEFESSS